ncbi:hypothetical protein NKH18_23825 [Streptomyces sp. M10(2022)]
MVRAVADGEDAFRVTVGAVLAGCDRGEPAEAQLVEERCEPLVDGEAGRVGGQVGLGADRQLLAEFAPDGLEVVPVALGLVADRPPGPITW